MTAPAHAPGLDFTSLSDRERQVLGMAAAGMLDKQIGLELGVSLNTLRTYWTRIRTKLGGHARTALVAAFVADEMRGDDGAAILPVKHEGWVIDVPSMTMVASDSINDLHGLERGVPHATEEYSRLYHPEDRDATRTSIREVIEGRAPTAHLVFRLVLESGIELVHLTLHGVKGADGQTKRVYGYRTRTLDCRAGREPNVRIGHWERNYPDPELWIDEELSDIFGGPGTGVISLDEARVFIHPEDWAQMESGVNRAIESGEERVQNESRFVRTDGRVVWCRVDRRIIRLSPERVKVLGTVIVFH